MPGRFDYDDWYQASNNKFRRCDKAGYYRYDYEDKVCVRYYSENELWWRGAAKGAAIGTACALGFPWALGAIGFGGAGVAAGSLAAGAQGAATVAGSTFAVAQSIGAAGLATKTVVGSAAAGAYFGSDSDEEK